MGRTVPMGYAALAIDQSGHESESTCRTRSLCMVPGLWMLTFEQLSCPGLAVGVLPVTQTPGLVSRGDDCHALQVLTTSQRTNNQRALITPQVQNYLRVRALHS